MSLTRRQFLKNVGVFVGTGWVLSSPQAWEALAQEQPEERDLLFVINNGDASISVIDIGTDEVVKTFFVGTTASFPANKLYERGPLLITGLHADGEPAVHIVDLRRGEVVAKIETGSAQNYTETTPDGRYAVVAARFVDEFLKIDVDPDGETFGEVLARFQHLEGAQPCDITLSPDGTYAYAPDRGTDTFSVLDVESFELVATVPVPPLIADPPIEPFMATASPDGRYVFVENIEGQGTVSVFDVSDPTMPREVGRFTQEQGLGVRPLTDEFTPDGTRNFIISRNSSDLTVVDVEKLEIVGRIPLVEGGNPVAGDFSPDGAKLYVPIQNRNVVAVVDAVQLKLVRTIEVGPNPVGAVALRTSVPPVEGVALGSLPLINPPTGCALPCCESA
jgi:YVTN family beta-propeller protein